ncbi:MAG TPA: hypothetical protein DHV30_03300 [Balneola sp.]|nr:hypothetical protein [Balneola sp.]
MSKYFTKSNRGSSKNLFNKRLLYKNLVHGSRFKNVVSFLDGEKILFGRMDRRFVPITVSNSSLKYVGVSADSLKPVKAVNFVADLFNEMVLQFDKCSTTGKIDANDPFLSRLKAYKAYVDPEAQYETYKLVYFNALKNHFKKNLIRFKDFDEFINLLMPIIKISAAKQPLTYTGYIKSNNCNVLNTGLAIEIANLSYDNDLDKINNFVKSKNWRFFVNACDSYGFMIDYNCPWRIVADIGAEHCIEMAKRYGLNNVEQILGQQYSYASIKGLQELGKMLLDLYNNIRPQKYHKTVNCDDGSTKRMTIKTQNYNPSDFFERYPASYFVDLYLKIRIYEEQPMMPEHEVSNIIKEQNRIFNSTGATNSINEKFESIINKTFDKRGSLTYTVNADRAKMAAAFEEGTVENIIITDDNSDFSNY